MRRFLSAVLTFLIVASFAVAPAFAGQAEETPSTSIGTISTNALSSGPYGCDGFSHNPHPSRHVSGTVNAQGQTKCPTTYPTIYAYAELYKDGALVTSSQAYANNSSKTTATVNVTAYCDGRSHKWEIKTYHYVTFPNGQGGSAWTNNIETFAC